MVGRARALGRHYNQVRPVRVQYDLYGYAAASVLFELGNTKVLCSVDMQQGVPAFLRGKKTGWLKAEYGMLPASTTTRFARESSSCAKNGRLVEISRLIGRSLRSTINLDVIGERTITIDCDVLQADGGTRTAAITGASLALFHAAQRWKASGEVIGELVRERVGAISVGIIKNDVLLDLDCTEDTAIDADFNFVLTQAGAIVEIQGTAENKPVAWEDFTKMCSLATDGIHNVFTQLDAQSTVAPAVHQIPATTQSRKAPFFSLANRITVQRNDDGSFNVS